jgi:hypothetical protein
VTARNIEVHDAVIIEIAKLSLSQADILWVKLAPENPISQDWEAMHMIQHALQDVLDQQMPELKVLVIVAPGDAEPVVLSEA